MIVLKLNITKACEEGDANDGDLQASRGIVY